MRPELSKALANALEISSDGRIALNLDKFKISGSMTSFERQTTSVLRGLGVSDKDLIGHPSYGRLDLSNDTIETIQRVSPELSYKINQLRPDLAPDLPSTQVPRSVASTLSEVGTEIPTTRAQDTLDNARVSSPNTDVPTNKATRRTIQQVFR